MSINQVVDDVTIMNDPFIQVEDHLKLIAKVFEHGIEGIFITDSDLHILKVNRAFTLITGFAADDIIGKIPAVIASGQDDSHLHAKVWYNIARHGYWSGETMERRRDGSLFTNAITITEVRNVDGDVTNYIGVFSDISDRKASESRVHQLAYYDTLTGLPNRALFNDRLELELKRSKREQTQGAIIFIDLDNFKYINDSYGHHKGDEFLEEIARRLKSATREMDTIARLCGDEFTVLISEMSSPRDVDITANRIVDALKHPFFIDENAFSITASIGVSLYPQDASDASTLLKNADIAMYRAKEKGKNSIEYFTEELNQSAVKRVSMENSLRHAIAKREFFVHYLPQIDLATGAISGVEALARWVHPEKGLYQPSLFIPIAEECGIIDQISHHVMNDACQQARRWLDCDAGFGAVSVNISARQFERGTILNLVKETLSSSCLPPQHLEIEITENLMMIEPEKSRRVLSQLKDMGVSIAIDDFGTGFSSLNYLKSLPVNRLKIDKGFITDILHAPDNKAITASIIDLSHHLGLDVVAEGIESTAQMELLKSLGCNKGQGYLFSKPVPADEFMKLACDSSMVLPA